VRARLIAAAVHSIGAIFEKKLIFHKVVQRHFSGVVGSVMIILLQISAECTNVIFLNRSIAKIWCLSLVSCFFDSRPGVYVKITKYHKMYKPL